MAIVSRGGGALAMVMTSVADPVPPTLVAPIVTLVLPVAVGTPLIMPVLALIASPDGNGTALHVLGVSEAVIWYENEVFTMPLAVRLLEITGTGGSAIFVRENDAAPEAPDAVAVTVNDPVMMFAVMFTLATPREFVTALMVEVPLLKSPLGPLLGVTKVTVTPGIGFSEPLPA
jgi:hypothetical protein